MSNSDDPFFQQALESLTQHCGPQTAMQKELFRAALEKIFLNPLKDMSVVPTTCAGFLEHESGKKLPVFPATSMTVIYDHDENSVSFISFLPGDSFVIDANLLADDFLELYSEFGRIFEIVKSKVQIN